MIADFYSFGKRPPLRHGRTGQRSRCVRWSAVLPSGRLEAAML